MPAVKTTLDHSLVNVKMDIKVMELPVLILMNAQMEIIGVTPMLLVPTRLEATNVNATLDTMVMVLTAVTLMNVLKVSVISMPNAKILLVHFHVHVIMDTLVMVFRAVT